MRGILIEISDKVLDRTDQEYFILQEQFFNQRIHLGCGSIQLLSFDTFADNVYFTW